MRNLLIVTSLALGATALGTTAAHARLPDAYVGAGISQARINDIFDSGHDLDLNNTAWKAFAGIRPLPFPGGRGELHGPGQ